MNLINKYIDDICVNIMKNKLQTNSVKNSPGKCVHIPQIGEHDMLINNKYNLPTLKSIAKLYKLKISGNKTQLISRIYSYLYLSETTIKIQKMIRGNIQRKYDSLHGPAYKKRNLCVNAVDFLSMENVVDIPQDQFFSFKDANGFIYGFEILSIFQLIMKNGKRNASCTKNPYNGQIISRNVVMQLTLLLHLSRILKITVCINISDVTKDMPDKKTIELRTLALFQNIDALGNYSDENWFLALNKNKIIKFMRELMDIWQHRAQLSMEIKRAICPPFGNPFAINFGHLHSLENIQEIRKEVLIVLEKFVNSGIDKDSKCLGSYYVLCALTLVNENAATSLPWLYQSVAYA